MTPQPPPMDLSVFYYVDPRPTPPVVKLSEQPAPPTAATLLPYEVRNLMTRARLNRLPSQRFSPLVAAAA
jgi:hypothetical protein